MRRNSRSFGNVSEGSVSIVAKQPTRHRLLNFWNAIVALAVIMDSPRLVLLLAEIHKLAHKQIQPSIIVIIEPHCAGRPPGRGHPGLFRYIRKRPISIVVKENAPPVLRHIKIRESVPVVIAHSHTLPKSPGPHPRFFRNIGKCSVPVVVIQRIALRRIWSVKIAFPAIDQINVHPPVIVIIQKCAARSGRFRQIFLRRFCVGMPPGNATGRRRNLFEWKLAQRKRPRYPRTSPDQRPRGNSSQQIASCWIQHDLQFWDSCQKNALRSVIPAWLHPAGSSVSTGAESQILSPLPLFCQYGSRPPPGCNARRDFLVACAQRPPAAVSLLRNASKQQGKLPNLGTLPRNSNRVLRLAKIEG